LGEGAAYAAPLFEIGVLGIFRVPPGVFAATVCVKFHARGQLLGEMVFAGLPVGGKFAVDRNDPPHVPENVRAVQDVAVEAEMDEYHDYSGRECEIPVPKKAENGRQREGAGVPGAGVLDDRDSGQLASLFVEIGDSSDDARNCLGGRPVGRSVSEADDVFESVFAVLRERDGWGWH
jgi:hypothetical protein